MDLKIGNHRLRHYCEGFALEYKQATASGEERWREKWYPSNLAHGLELLFEQEFKSRAGSCTELEEVIGLIRTLGSELKAAAQSLDTSGSV